MLMLMELHFAVVKYLILILFHNIIRSYMDRVDPAMNSLFFLNMHYISHTFLFEDRLMRRFSPLTII